MPILDTRYTDDPSILQEGYPRPLSAQYLDEIQKTDRFPSLPFLGDLTRQGGSYYDLLIKGYEKIRQPFYFIVENGEVHGWENVIEVMQEWAEERPSGLIYVGMHSVRSSGDNNLYCVCCYAYMGVEWLASGEQLEIPNSNEKTSDSPTVDDIGPPERPPQAEDSELPREETELLQRISERLPREETELLQRIAEITRRRAEADPLDDADEADPPF